MTSKDKMIEVLAKFNMEDILRAASMMDQDRLGELIVDLCIGGLKWFEANGQGPKLFEVPVPAPTSKDLPPTKPAKVVEVPRVYRGKKAALGVRGPLGGYLPIAVMDNRGITYSSIKDAARQNGVSDTSIRQAILKGKRVKGILYRPLADEVGPIGIQGAFDDDAPANQGQIAQYRPKVQSGKLSFK